MLTLFGILKGLLIQQESDRTKEFTLEVDASASSGTRTTLKSKQTDDRVLELPDASGELVEKDFAQTLTQKEIDADLNTILNIKDENIKAGAAIDATKIADGSVDNTEFQALNGVVGNIQAQLDTKTTVTGLVDNTLIKADGTNSIQSTGITIDDLNRVTGVRELTADVRLRASTLASNNSLNNIDLNNGIIVTGLTNLPVLNIPNRTLQRFDGSVIDMLDWSNDHLDVNGNLIKNAANPVDPQDVATKAYVDAQGGGGANTSLTNLVSPVQPNQDLDFQNTNKITGLPAPTLGSDAANKDYVDSVVGGANQQLSNLVGPVQPNQSFDFQELNTITGLPTPVNPSDVATKDYVDNIPTGGRIVTGSFNSPVSVGDSVEIPVLSESLDEDIYIEGNGTLVGWQEMLSEDIDSNESGTQGVIALNYSPTVEKYVAVLPSNTSNGIFYYGDKNKKSWLKTFDQTEENGDILGAFSQMLYVPFLDSFVCVYQNNTQNTTFSWVSKNGIDFKTYDLDLSLLPYYLLQTENKLILFGYYISNNIVLESLDGKTWTTINTNFADNTITPAVAYGDGKYLISQITDKVYRSTDLNTWTEVLNTTLPITSIIYSKKLNLFTVFLFGTEDYYTSPDGITWTLRELPISTSGSGKFGYSEEQNKFIFAVFVGIGDFRVYESEDGINWSLIDLGEFNPNSTVGNIEYINNEFVLVNSTGFSYTPLRNTTISKSPQIEAATSEGKRLTIIGTDEANAVTLNNGNGLKLNSEKIRLGENDIVEFRWNSDLNLWVQK